MLRRLLFKIGININMAPTQEIFRGTNRSICLEIKAQHYQEDLEGQHEM